MSKVKIDDVWYDVPDPVVTRMQENYDAMKTIAKKYDELGTAILKVRDLQKLYFKTKAFNILDEAKAAERELDDILSGKANSKQQALF